MAPVARDGRIYFTAVVRSALLKYYAVCADADTGQVLWRRYLGAGQVELTMFGEHAVEPLHMMPALSGEAVHVCAPIGVTATLSALSGEL